MQILENVRNTPRFFTNENMQDHYLKEIWIHFKRKFKKNQRTGKISNLDLYSTKFPLEGQMLLQVASLCKER